MALSKQKLPPLPPCPNTPTAQKSHLPLTLPTSRLKDGRLKSAPSALSSPVNKTTSLDTRTTTSSTSASSALVHFLPLLLLQRSTTVHTLLGALNLTTRQDTTAKCLAHSTALFVNLSSNSHQNPGQILAQKPPSATCSCKTLTPSSTTMTSPTLFLPAKMTSTSPSCSR